MQHKISAVLLFLLVPAAMIACILLQSPQTALLSTLVLLAALTPFFLAFERQKPRPRDFMPVVVLTALSVTGRLLFAALPNFKPVSAIVILAGVCFGRQSGFLTGTLSALVSNLFFGQGPWTPWQMYAWGLMGYVAGALASTKLFRRPWAVLLYGFLARFGYGFLMNSWTLFSFVQPVQASGYPDACTMLSAALPQRIGCCIAGYKIRFVPKAFRACRALLPPRRA